MKQTILILALITFTLADLGKWGVEDDENVAVLTNENFADFVSKNQKVFVKFYAPWCGHCKAMAPGYSSLAKRMNEQEDGIPIAKVDATIHKELAEKYGVSGFPTLKYFMEGEPVDYSGAREENDIYNWIMKKSGPATTELKTSEDLEKHSGMSLSVLFVLPSGDEGALKKFMAVANSYEDVAFAHTFDEEHKKSLEVNMKYGFVVFRDFDDGKKFLVNDNEMTTESMKNFFEAVRFPTVMEFNQKTAEKIFGSESSAMFYFTDDSSDSGLTTFQDFAKENKGEIIFSQSSITTGLGARLSEFLGVTADMAPCVRVVNFKSGQLQKYKVDGNTTEDMKKALTGFKEGTLTAYYKSASVPETNDEAVKIVVGDTFEELVQKNDKYVLLEAYAPWCGHCKKLEPIYKELAERLADQEDIVIAKMDSTANEHPSLQIQGFPTLKLYKPASETPTDYTGDRSLKDLVTFLETELGRTFESLKTEEL